MGCLFLFELLVFWVEWLVFWVEWLVFGDEWLVYPPLAPPRRGIALLGGCLDWDFWGLPTAEPSEEGICFGLTFWGLAPSDPKEGICFVLEFLVDLRVVVFF